MRTISLYFLLGMLVVLSITACSDEFLTEHPGDLAEIGVSPDDFRTLKVDGIFNVYLIEDTFNFVVFTGGMRELGQVEGIVIDSCLILYNNNTSFLKPSGARVNAYVHFTDLRYLRILEPSKITGQGSISSLKGISKDTYIADIDVELNCPRFLFYDTHMSAGTLKVSGSVGKCKFILHYAIQTDFTSLKTSELVVENKSKQDVYVNVEEELTARIFDEGNIFYSGSPRLILDTAIGTGRLLPWREYLSGFIN
ncbi:MAG: DUF2807 domain-containing protein [Bacteroidales bacterium]|nr:DUF2807 domain-containing protein [Bacteroidales bacterium]